MMQRFFNKNMKTPNLLSSRMRLNLSNARSYTRNKFSTEPVSSHLDVLLNKYFHPYQFFTLMNPLDPHPLDDFSTLLFDVNQENTTDLNYKVTTHFDPVRKLVSKILERKLEAGFKIHRIGAEPLCIYFPDVFLPMHISLRIRDEMEGQQIKTLTEFNDLALDRKAKIVKYPFDFKLNINQLISLQIPDSYFSKIQKLQEEERLRRQTEINNVINCWNLLSEAEQESLLDEFYYDYYRLYIEGSCHKNSIGFNIHNKDWDLYLTNSRDLNDPVNASNTAAQLIKFSQYRHSSVKGYHVSFTSGGALRINNYCPGIIFLQCTGFDVHHDWEGIDVAMRHIYHYNPKEPIGSHDRNVDKLYAWNGFISYHDIINLKASCDAFGIKTSGLTIPVEMQPLLNQTNVASYLPVWK